MQNIEEKNLISVEIHTDLYNIKGNGNGTPVKKPNLSNVE